MEKLSARDFSGDRLLRDGDWAVCFSAEWCGYCHSFFKYHFSKMEGQVPFSIGLGDVTDYDSPLWAAFHLEVIPVMIAFRNGKAIWRKDGVQSYGLDARDVAALKEALK